MSRRRVFLYVQHLLGIGHLKRALTLASALADAGLDVTLASGGFTVPGLAASPAIRWVQLPAVGTADMSFKNLVDEQGMPVDDAWKRARTAALLAAYAQCAPELLLIELFPFGRRQMRFELIPLLDAARGATPRPLVVSSVRDIGADGQHEPSRQALILDLLDHYFDRVLVHSDPRWIRFERTYAYSDAMSAKLHYTGFIVESRRLTSGAADAGRGEVIVSAGGGAVGRALLETAARTRTMTSLADRTWRLLAGLNAQAAAVAALEALAAESGGRVVVERMRDDFTTLLANCALSISQAGYNTTMEILEAGTRAVVVPFAGGGETEQTLRASLLAERGRVQVVSEPMLAPATLATAVERALDGPAPGREPVDLDGARQSAALIVQWIEEHGR